MDKKRKKWPGPVLTAAAILIVVCVWRCVFPVSGKDMDEESVRAVKAAVERCALQCYVVEGAYPSGLSYLTENYGLQINEKEFYVSYDIFASNVPPAVKVIRR
ncbi:MAG: hypothetical protein HFH93_14720 [Lachnospiraceae bacterium]|nr:hypothetical protein [Lachnospiraceae bacterium]